MKANRILKWSALCAAVILCCAMPSQVNAGKGKVGKRIPAWEKGYLDLHFINTGTGESTFMILPDGTQMLVDMAGAITRETDKMFMPFIPDNSRRPGEWVNRYMARCMEWTGNQCLDYVSLTHFHGDHIGNVPDYLPKSDKGDWKTQSVTDVIEGNQIGLLVDRGYPDYSYPSDMLATPNTANYVKCMNWYKENHGLKVERFVAGVDNQFVLKYDAEAYPQFKIQNVAVNGEFWTGNGTETKCNFPDKSTFSGAGKAKDPIPSENLVSSVFKLSYGNFDYYGGGDVSHSGYKYFDWKDMETPIAEAVGEVEVMKADHHGSYDANNENIVKGLSPQAVIVNVWRNVQPRGGIAKYIAPEVNNGEADIFLTNMAASKREELSEDMARVLSTQGHIVVRVKPGGKSYFIYILKDSDESMEVTARFGPYRCR